MRHLLVPMIFTVLGAHMSGTEFQYPYRSFKEPCGMMADLVAESGGNKGQLSNLVETLCHNFRIPDETGPQKLIEWQKQVKWSWSTRRSLNRTQSSDNVPYRTFGTRRIRNFVVQARGTRLERFSNGSRRNSTFLATSQEFRRTLCLTFNLNNSYRLKAVSRFYKN